MSDLEAHCDSCPLSGHAVIAGFGVPGRAVGELMAARRMPYCVIERNPQTVDRCALIGVHIISGDIREEQTLRRAGVDRAVLFAVAVPDEQAVLEAVRLAHAMNPRLHI